MGGVFARGFLRLGHPVFPANRGSDLTQLAQEITNPAAVLVAVGEKDLTSILEQLPSAWHDKLCLLQNELLPKDWEGFGEPTVISVWFEKKKGMDAKVIIPSPVYGRHAQLIADALQAVDIPTKVLDTPEDLLFELVVKNLYILTSNIAGLKTGGTVGQLWDDHRPFAQAVVADIIALQEAMTDSHFDHEKLVSAMVMAFEGDPDHQCMGRSAPARLERALQNSESYKLTLNTLQTIASETTK